MTASLFIMDHSTIYVSTPRSSCATLPARSCLRRDSHCTSETSTSSTATANSAVASPAATTVKKASSMPSGRRRKRVAFSTCDIYEFPSILGDHPGVSSGAPLTLDWVHETHATWNVFRYEFQRRPSRSPSPNDLKLSAAARHDYLESKGYSSDEIQGAAHQAASIRRKRERGVHSNKNWDKLHIVMESLRWSNPHKSLSSSKRRSSRPPVLWRRTSSSSASSKQQPNTVTRAA